MSTTTSSHERVDEGISDTNEAIQIILPNCAFRDTNDHELSIVSFNMLASSYHCIGLSSSPDFVKQDRSKRMPLSMDMAKQTNADVLCLQEVENTEFGDDDDDHDLIGDVLKQDLTLRDGKTVKGYDQHVWSALHPNRRQDVVGLCVAWRSQKHTLISCDRFKRGMVVQLKENATGATICIGNVHLPAKPADITGRFATLSTAIKAMEACEGSLSSSSSLDGTLIMTGDFNCEPHSVVVTGLLQKGNSPPYGTVHDRNYRAKISKDRAYNMRHPFSFEDAYRAPQHDGMASLRATVAPITVSLSGHCPGCMDQMHYTNRRARGGAFAAAPKPHYGKTTKRGLQRARGLRRAELAAAAAANAVPSPLCVKAVLATMYPDDQDRERIIYCGLPNLAEGFPSDHLPIGALFAPKADNSMSNTDTTGTTTESSLVVKKDNNNNNDYYTRASGRSTGYKGVSGRSGGISWKARIRRESYSRSVISKKRHNTVLRVVMEWLMDRGAKHVIRDKPLYKWKEWIVGSHAQLKNKQRAPDLCCVLNDRHLVLVEVAVAGINAGLVRQQKCDKYSDLPHVLRSSPKVMEAGLEVADVLVIIMENDEEEKNAVAIPNETMDDLCKLALLSAPGGDNALLESRTEEGQRLGQVIKQALIDSKE